ncbi:hypothetical protein O9929_14125 [Vibrio lentus]|nr:hypothetical protein [Vibrio lentus]
MAGAAFVLMTLLVIQGRPQPNGIGALPLLSLGWFTGRRNPCPGVNLPYNLSVVRSVYSSLCRPSLPCYSPYLSKAPR